MYGIVFFILKHCTLWYVRYMVTSLGKLGLNFRFSKQACSHFLGSRSVETFLCPNNRDLDKVAMNKLGLLRPKIPVSFGLGTRGTHGGHAFRIDFFL
jgi:hypothetical protein